MDATRSETGLHEHPRFRDLALLGSGSMGVVYRAYDVVLQQFVAVKTLLRPDPDQIYWLKSEFRSLADVRHPNLVELHELVSDESHCFFIMELLEGVDLVTFVDRLLLNERLADADPVKVATLYDCIRQLVAGVQAIHDAGKLHRDIKPSNILVTREHRVVLLDFGLTVPLRSQSSPALPGAGVTGTFAYMSPEQTWGQPLSLKSDWYGVGAVLYEALTRELSSAGLVSVAPDRDPRPELAARLRARGVPNRLAAAVVALLSPDPAERPGADEILDRFEATPSSPLGARAPLREQFVGRLDELQRLQRSLERAERGAVTVHVQGESGIGKTTLLQRFAAGLEAEDAGLVLRGRCHPHESVPYKALDGVLDGLTNHLLRDDVDAAALVPADVEALLQLFPVLGRVPAFGGREEGTPMGDPVETRRRGVGALREMLATLSVRRPVVVWIDDLQWGDSDSATLLRALLAHSDLTRMLVLLSYRSEDAASSPVLKELAGAPLEHDPSQRSVIQLLPLSSGEARTLARRLVAQTQQLEIATDIAREAGGSPFLIQQLAWYSRARGGAAGDRRASTRIGDLVLDRISLLDESSRRILDVVCLAAAPLNPDSALEAARVGIEGRSQITMMQSDNLLRLTPQGGREAVRPYHDRIREAVVADIAADQLRDYHRALADTLSARPEADPEALFTHFLGAGDTNAALPHLERAADRAAEALAFGRAATLYETALGLKGVREGRIELVIRHAEALNNGGRSAEAATGFQEAAELLAAKQADTSRVLGLRRRAAECFLRSGRYDQGSRILSEVLREAGVTLPGSDRSAMTRALLIRLPYMFGDLRRRLRRTKTSSHATARRLEVLWGASQSLTLTDHPLGAFLGAKFLRDALTSDNPTAVVCAIAYEAACETPIGTRFFQRRAERLLALADRLAERSGDSYAVSFALAARGTCAWFEGRWRSVLEHFGASLELVRNRPGAAWEIAVAQVNSLSALSFLGDMRTLAHRLAEALQDAVERGDLFAANNYRLGQQSFCRLAADEPEHVLALAEEARASMPPHAFHIQHYHHVTIATQCHLYLRQPRLAWQVIEEAWPRLAAAQLLHMVFPRAELWHLRARTALALAEWLRSEPNASMQRPPGWTPEGLLREAARAARRVRHARTLPAGAFAAMIDAGLASSRGDAGSACAHLEDAIEGFRVAEMLLHREAARFTLGRLLGGEGGRALVTSATSRMVEQVKQVPAVVRTLAPGFGEAVSG